MVALPHLYESDTGVNALASICHIDYPIFGSSFDKDLRRFKVSGVDYSFGISGGLAMFGFLLALCGRCHCRDAGAARRFSTHLKPQRVFQLALGEQSPGRGGVIFDDTAQRAWASRPAAAAFSLYWILSSGASRQALNFGVAELGRVFLHAGARAIVFVATHLHGQQPAADQVVMRLPAPRDLAVAELDDPIDRDECFIDGICRSLGDALIGGHHVLEFRSVGGGKTTVGIMGSFCCVIWAAFKTAWRSGESAIFFS